MRWQGKSERVLEPLTGLEKLRAVIRGAGLMLGTFVLLLCYWLALVLEKFLPRLGLTTFIIWLWCAMGTRLCGLRLRVEGVPMQHGGARVANHASWADIFVLRAAAQMFYVAKAEVRDWPLMGMIGAHTGTMFITRDRTQAKAQEALFLDRLRSGDRLCFFPEGTSSDSLRVLPFKSTLFAAFMAKDLAELMWIQPVSVVYHPRAGLAEDSFGWWGNMPFGAHLIDIFGKSYRSDVFVIFHDPVRAADFSDRKALAAHCEEAVRRGHAEKLLALGRSAISS